MRGLQRLTPRSDPELPVLSRNAPTSPVRSSLRGLGELACFAAPVTALLWALRGPLASLGQGLWGPEQPWGNGDFVGNFWCWWREAELQATGVEWLEATGWPGGGGVLDQLFPNRIDAWLALPWFQLDSWWRVWNTMGLALPILAILATVLAARLAGASRMAAASAGLVLAMSPTLLHELGWGRMAGMMICPGVLALAAVAAALRAPRIRSPAALLVAAGLLLVLQAVAYPFHGLAAGLACAVALLASPLPWRRRGLWLAVLAATIGLAGLPWLVSQASDFSALAGAPPPAGYTSMPAAGLLGLGTVPERFRLLPLALPLSLLALGSVRARPWALAGLAVLALAMGPRLAWVLGGPSLTSPMAALMAASSWFARMHHPVRAAPMGLAALGVAVALLLDPTHTRLRWLRVAGLASLWLGAFAVSADLARVTTWNRPTEPPGVDAARWLAAEGDGPVADVLSGQHMAGVALQPWHRRPLLETVQGYGPASGGAWSPEQQAAAVQLQALARGDLPGSGTLASLEALGAQALLVVDRQGHWDQAPDPQPALAALTTALGPPAYQDAQAAVWLLGATTPR